MLETIAEATALCSQAQCHYKQAESLAANMTYRRVDCIHQQRKALVDALREARLGKEKLQTSFSVFRKNVLLMQQYPVLTSQEGSLPLAALQKLEAHSVDRFESRNSYDVTEKGFLNHCTSILRFVHECEDISTHQQKILEAVSAKIHADNTQISITSYPGGREDNNPSESIQAKHASVHVSEEFFHPNSSHPQYGNHYYDHHQDYDMPGSGNAALNMTDGTKLDHFLLEETPQSTHHEFAIETRREEGQHCQYDPPPRSATHATGHNAEFEPLPMNHEVIDLSTEEEDFEPIKMVEFSVPERLPIICPGDIFELEQHNNHQSTLEDTTSKQYTSADVMKVSTDNSVTAPATMTETKIASASRSFSEGDKPKVRRVKSGGLLEKKKRPRRPPRRSPKRNKSGSAPPPSDPVDFMALAMGGRVDFLEDKVAADSTTRGETDGYDSCDHDINDFPLEFPFDDPCPTFRRNYSY